jgi:hypothetical protein
MKPLGQDAAQQTFTDIADGTHKPDEVEKVLSLTDNMPLAITLLAELVDLVGCPDVLSRWGREKTSLISEGYDRRSNLDLSISLSLSSPRIKSHPDSRDLLSLLSMLPDGLSDVELVQSQLPISDVLGCKVALIRTAVAYTDEHKQLKVLIPIKEYIQKFHPPIMHLIQPLREHFQQLLNVYRVYSTTHSETSQSGTVARISSNYSNIQTILMHGLQNDHRDLVNSIYGACNLNHFSLLTGRGKIALMDQIPNSLPQPAEHRVEAYFITELINSWRHYPLLNPETLMAQALEHLNHIDDMDLKGVHFVNSCFSIFKRGF